MQLAPMRYTKFDGTAVAVTVTSAAEAKLALKELRHKKREIKFLRGALARRQKVARARRAKGKPEPGMLQTFVSDLRWGIAALASGVPAPPSAKARPRSAAEIDEELRQADEMLHNIDGCILQLQGKLLAHD